MSITIEKGVDIPPVYSANRRVLEIAGAMQIMEVGDSIVLPDHFETFRRASKVADIFISARAVYGQDGKRTGYRVWRVAERTKKSIATSRSHKKS